MDAFRSGLGLLVPMLALAGFTLTLTHKTKLTICLAPAVACSGVALCVTLAAVAGALLPVTAGLWALGVAALAAELWRRRRRLGALCCVSTVFLALFAAYAALRLKGLTLLHYDNFSHWALLTDWLLRTDALPGAGDTLIVFPSYPPASACFSYFFARAAGGGEGVMAFGQAMWIGASAAALLGFAGRRKGLCYGALGLAFVVMLICNIFIDELLVDTLLPMVGLGALAVALQMGDDPRSAAVASLPILAALVLIKSSGLFFAALAGGALAWRAFGKSKREGWLILCWIAVACAAALLLWRLRVQLVFGGAQGKHAVDLGAYASGFADKLNSGALWQTVKNFAKRLVDPFAVQNQLLACLLLPMAALMFALPKEDRRRGAVKATLVGSLLLWAAWQFGILCMFAFSATEREALNLSGQQRYSLTMIVYLTGLSAILQCGLLSHAQRLSGRRELICAALSLLLAASPLGPLAGSLPCLWRPLNSSARRAELQALLVREEVAPGRRYMLYVDSYQDSVYTMYIARYLLRSEAVTVVDASAYRQEMTDGLAACDYLIFADSGGEAEAFAAGLMENPGYGGVVVVK